MPLFFYALICSGGSSGPVIWNVHDSALPYTLDGWPYGLPMYDGFEGATELGEIETAPGRPYWQLLGTQVFPLAVNTSNQCLEKRQNYANSYLPSTTYTLGSSTLPTGFWPVGGAGTLSNVNALGTTYVVGFGEVWDGTNTITLPGVFTPVAVNAATTTITGVNGTPQTVPATQVVGSVRFDSGGYIWNMIPSTSGPPTFGNPQSLDDLVPTNTPWSGISCTKGGWEIGFACINDSGAICAQGTYTPTSSTDTTPAGVHGLVLIPASLAVDANRDGTIVMANDTNNPANVDSHGNPLPVDSTSQAKPYRFWINNNEDQPSSSIEFGTSPKTVPPNSSNLDYKSNSIVSKLDLEDWTRLWISMKGLNTAIQSGAIKVGLKWQPLSGTTPGIKIVKATDSDGGIEYLSDTTGAAATAQATSGGSPRPVLQDANDSHTNIVPNTTGAAADFVFPTSVWSSLSDTAPKTYFLFEGTSRGQGQLQVVFLKSDGTTLLGSGGNLWLDIRDVKEMYQRAIAAGAGPSPTPPTEPYNSNSAAFNDGSIGTSIDSNNPFVAPPDETSQCVVFVHGWYTDWNGFTEYTEDLYKRLWWQGYKGRVVGFTWPALSGPTTYNPSEWNAWLYGRAFKNYVSSIEGGYTNFTVAGHSQGNVVVGSAIQEGLTIPNYILLQAALPTGCYTTNNAYNNYTRFINQEATYPTPDTAANLGYRGFITPEFGNVGHYYCFFNPQDYALATGQFSWGTLSFAANWEANQLNYKPDGNPGGSGAGYYNTSPGTPNYNPVVHGVPQANRAVTDGHESMSFVARPRSQAVGADPNSPAVFGAANTTDLHATYGFGGAETDHSGQFLRDYDQVYPLYQQFETIIAPKP